MARRHVIPSILAVAGTTTVCHGFLLLQIFMSLEKKGHLLGKTHPLLPQGAVPDPVEII